VSSRKIEIGTRGKACALARVLLYQIELGHGEAPM
jgi:hypothetical protein